MSDYRFETSEFIASLMMSTHIFSDAWSSCDAANSAGSIKIQHIAGIMYVALPVTPMSQQLGDLVGLKASGDGLFPALDSEERPPMVDAAILKFFLLSKIKEALESELVGRKLVVITGHSTGGVLAALTALSLLCSQPPPLPFCLLCITFGSPLLGNKSLSSSVARSRFGHNFCHVVSIYDHIPRTTSEHFCPFGTYLLCSDNGGVCLDNAESVRRMFQMLNTTITPNIEEHQRYGHYVSTLSHQFLRSRSFLGGGNISNNSYEAGVALAVEALGLSNDEPIGVSVKACIEAAARIGRAPIERAAALANELASVLPARLEIQWYKDRCDTSEEQLGYYDFFKRYSSKRDFKVNMSRKRLAIFWDKVLIQMVEKNELPYDFHLGKKWVYASQFYQLLAEPLDIADFYRNRDPRTHGHYLDERIRPKRYQVIDKWWKQTGNSDKFVRSRLASTTQDTCFWAKLEEAKEYLDEVGRENIDAQRRSSLWEKIFWFESYAKTLVNNMEVSLDVVAKNSSYKKWQQNLDDVKLRMGHGNGIEMIVDENVAMET